MADSQVTVALKERCFASFTVGGVEVELFVDGLAPGGVALAIRSPKKIGALRVYQELPGMAPVKSVPEVMAMDRKRA